ncbi:MAG: hypothetical protein LUE64_03615 [Candidatus Gastranaerophilales bacterium]|nr:hypothetical protein [Candidatus Gastranaerophilales bacterium]
MGSGNTVVIVSDAGFLVNEIKNMLVLLRDVDSVSSCSYFEAEEYINDKMPAVILLHAAEKDKNPLKLLSRIKKNSLLKDIPVILYADYPDADFIIEAFDKGITDILSAPLKDYELVIRVIWAIQENEKRLVQKTKEKFLQKLGIIDEDTALYKEEFSIRYLESVIAQIKETKQNACLILIKTHPAIKVSSNKEHFVKSVKSSVRINDTIAMKDNENCFILLSKSKLNGVYSVYERLVSHLRPITTISASAVEIQDELFDDILIALENAVKKAEKGEISIVTKKDFTDLFNEDKEELGIAKILNGEAGTENDDKIQEKNELALIENIEPFGGKPRPEEEAEISRETEILNEKVEAAKKNNVQKKVKLKSDTHKNEASEIDIRNAILSKQAYSKKLKIFVEPALKKYAAKFQNEYTLIDADVNVSFENTFLKLDKDDVKLDFQMNFDGIKTINFKLGIYALETPLEQDFYEIEVMDFDSKKLEIILDTLVMEYKNYLKP